MEKSQIRGILTDISCIPTNSPDRDLYTLMLDIGDAVPQPIYVHTDYDLNELLKIGETYILTGEQCNTLFRIDKIRLVQEILTDINWHS